MMELGSLIGFTLVFIALSWTISLLAGSLVWLGGYTLRRFGSCAERTAAASALTIAPTLSAALTLALMWQSLASAGGGDHCLVHGHHPHLCLYHGGVWGELRWPILTLAPLIVVFIGRFAERMRSLWTARITCRALDQAAEPPADADVRIAPAQSVFCFATGLFRPRIYISDRAWEKLDECERQAVVAHERAHIRQGDVWRGYALSILILFGAPLLSRWLVKLWKDATERLCDRRAAQIAGQDALAGALLKLARAGRHQPMAFANSLVTGVSVVDRIEAVLRDEPVGLVASRWLSVAVVGVGAVVMAIGVAYVDPLHHALETLLGMI